MEIGKADSGTMTQTCGSLVNIKLNVSIMQPEFLRFYFYLHVPMSGHGAYAVPLEAKGGHPIRWNWS